jgi:hypothetical protein
VAAGDRIQIRNLSISNPTVAQTDFLDYMQDVSGLMVVGTAYSYVKSAAVYVSDNFNSAGYSRYIIVRNRFADPTTGSTALNPFGKQANNSTLASSIVTRNFNPGRLINLSHQTQLIFRVITREYDSLSLIRPDNL